MATLAAPGMRLPLVLHSEWMRRAVPADRDLPGLHFGDELARVDELDPDDGASDGVSGAGRRAVGSAK